VPVLLKISTQGFEATAGRFARAQSFLPHSFQQRLGELMRSIRDVVRAEAPPNLSRYVTHRTEMLSHSPARALGKIDLEQPPNPPYPAEIWDYIIKGTKPHPIVPRRARALAFYWEKVGADVVLPHVNHPGTDPNDFPARAWRRIGRGHLERTAAKIGLDVVGVLGGQ